MGVALIVAMDQERGIGKNNDLMWHLPADMKFFKETTTGQIVVMGRKNFESIPANFRPLPKRENVVLTRNENVDYPGVAVFHDFSLAIQAYQNDERTTFIIGGGEIYRLALEHEKVDTMYITHVNDTYGADTFFPDFSLEDWQVETLFQQDKDDRHKSSFAVLKYTRKK